MTFAYRQGSPGSNGSNAMDAFVAAVGRLDAAWRPVGARAEERVEFDLGGAPVPIGAGGRFRLSGAAAGRVLTARDGAGGLTSPRLARQGRRR